MKEPIYHCEIEYKGETYEVVTKDSKKYFKINIGKNKQPIEVEKKLCKLINKKQIGTLSIN